MTIHELLERFAEFEKQNSVIRQRPIEMMYFTMNSDGSGEIIAAVKSPSGLPEEQVLTVNCKDSSFSIAATFHSVNQLVDIVCERTEPTWVYFLE